MKKTVLFMMMSMLIPALISTTNAESPRYGPRNEILNNVTYHAFVEPTKLGKIHGEEFRQAMLNLFDETKTEAERFQPFNKSITGFTPRQMMEIYRSNLMYILQTDRLTNTDMMNIVRASTIKPAPMNMGSTYEVGRIPAGGGLDLFYRHRYKRGDKMLNGNICQRDEEGMWLSGVFNNIPLDVMWVVDGCLNVTVPVEKSPTPTVTRPPLEEDPGKYSKKPLGVDTFIVNTNTNTNTNTPPSVYFITMPAAAPATPPSTPNTGGSTNQNAEVEVKLKRDFFDYANLVFNGATAVSTVKMAFFSGTSRGFGQYNQVYQPNPPVYNYPQYPNQPYPPYIPPTTGGHQGGSGSGTPIYYPTNTGGTSGGGYSNQW